MPHYWILINSMEITRQPHPALIHPAVHIKTEGELDNNQPKEKEREQFLHNHM